MGFFSTLTLYWCFAIDAISQAKTGFEKKKFRHEFNNIHSLCI